MTTRWITGINTHNWLASALLISTAIACVDGQSGLTASDNSIAQSGACIGPTPTAASWHATPSPLAGSAPQQATSTVGELAPDFALTDVQPLSCGYKATYGLRTFIGQPTLVALLAGW